MKFGSLFAGVGGFDLGFEAAGGVCCWQVEWDKHCQQVLGFRWPDVPKWEDVRDVSGYDLEPVDVITYGFPCQDLSVAGKQAGLDGDRSGLFFEAIRIIKEMRDATDGQFPRVVVAENVTGLLTADGGDAMGRCLDSLAEAGALVSEWCVLDSQWFGVPQRRRRVFLASVFDSSVAGRCTGEIFPLAQSGGGDSAESVKEGEEVAGDVEDGVGVGRSFRMLGFGHYADDDSASTLKARDYKDATDLVVMPISGKVIGRKDANTGNGRGYGFDGDPMFTLTTVDRHAVAVVPFVKSRRAQNKDDFETWVEGGPTPTLNQFDMGDVRSTVAILSFDTKFGSNAGVFENLSPTLKASQGSPSIATNNTSVRRLTPLECERLMGWPDEHTLYRSDGKMTSDSQRFKMCGNGVVAPVAEWVAKQIGVLL